MTQAYNLAILANAVDTSGRLNVGTNATGILPLANGGTGTTNTVNSVVAGSGISVSTSGTQVTISSSGGSGTVTSVATGNGLQGGTITTSGTLSIAAPGYLTVGSYIFAGVSPNNPSSNYSNMSILGFDGESAYFAGSAGGTWRSSGTVGNPYGLFVRLA